MLYLGSIRMDRVISELCYKGTIIGKWPLNVKFHCTKIWEPQQDHVISVIKTSTFLYVWYCWIESTQPVDKPYMPISQPLLKKKFSYSLMKASTYLDVWYGGVESTRPVDKPYTSIYQPFLMQSDEGLSDSST